MQKSLLKQLSQLGDLHSAGEEGWSVGRARGPARGEPGAGSPSARRGPKALCNPAGSRLQLRAREKWKKPHGPAAPGSRRCPWLCAAGDAAGNAAIALPTAGRRGDVGALGGAGGGGALAVTGRTCASVDLQPSHPEVAGGAGVDAHAVLADAVPPDEQEEPVVAGDAAVVLRAQDAARAVLQQAGARCRDKRRRGAAAGLRHTCTARPRHRGGSQPRGSPSPTRGGDSTVPFPCKCLPTSVHSPNPPFSAGCQRGDAQSRRSPLRSARASPPPSRQGPGLRVCPKGCQPEPCPYVSRAHPVGSILNNGSISG